MRNLLIALLLTALSGARQYQEVLFEHCPPQILMSMFEARYPGLHLLTHPQGMRGIRILVLDREPIAGSGSEIRLIRTSRILANQWLPYLHYRFPDLVVKSQGHSIEATGLPQQLDELQKTIDAFEENG